MANAPRKYFRGKVHRAETVNVYSPANFPCLQYDVTKDLDLLSEFHLAITILIQILNIHPPVSSSYCAMFIINLRPLLLRHAHVWGNVHAA